MARRRLWITWETQRRSIELAELLDSDLSILEAHGSFRYLQLAVRTILEMRRKAPQFLLVQNPSIVLTLLACAFAGARRIPLVVDRHSNFPEFSSHRAWQGPLGALRARVFCVLSNFTIRNAAITIVTNEPIAALVRFHGGTPFVLADPIPAHLAISGAASASDGSRVLVVCSFADDEPIAEILAAATMFPRHVEFRLTGNPVQHGRDWRANAPENVVFTGFLPRQEYENELRAASAILVLTKNENCLLCGCYEALAVGKPLITSRTQVLQRYFYDADHVDSTPDSIREGVCAVLGDLAAATLRTRNMSVVLSERWIADFGVLQVKLREIESGFTNKSIRL